MARWSRVIVIALALLLVVVLPAGAGSPRAEPVGLRPSELTRVGATLFFVGCTHATGCELWRSDGTARGTRMIRDINRDGLGRDPHGLVAAGDRLFFLASDEAHGEELWTSDGTRAGTRMVREILPGTLSQFLNWADGSRPLVAVGARVFFAARDGWHGWEPWVSDGTEAGTHLVKDLDPRGGTYPHLWVAVGDRAFFTGEGDKLWVTDGTASGTRFVRQFASGTLQRPERFAAMDGRLFIGGTRRLWVSDGTPTGTGLLKDFGWGRIGWAPVTNLTVIDHQLWFSARAEQQGSELWVSDGTAAGTRFVRELHPGPLGSSPGPFVRLGDRVLFSAESTKASRSIWRSDGTAAGTRLLPAPGVAEYAEMGSPIRLRGWVLFAAYRRAHPRPDHLWRTDGTVAGTEQIARIRLYHLDEYAFTVIGDVLYFVNDAPGTGEELWRSDGTREGTRIVKNLR